MLNFKYKFVEERGFNMKKILSALCSVLMLSSVLVSFSGCDSTDSKNENDADVANATESVKFAAGLKMGWNLGNTLDATDANDLESETSWGQPKATKELIEFVKKSGFTSIRIPVSWGNHTDKDFNIDKDWMKRVTEVVDYAIDAGLYVIINSHHDCDFYYPTEERFEKGEKYIKTVWAQIAENFKDYDEKLVFESMNEPRLKDTPKEWWFQNGDIDGLISIRCINKYNQAFVDTVRASGGNNATRYLMVPSNAASPENTLNSSFELPTDTANRLMVSVHAYKPYDFAMNAAEGYKDWDGSKIGELSFMDQLNDKFIKNGYGVVIGEYGATNKGNLDARVAWAKDFTGKAASLGISCFVWDNGGTETGDENFGLINRDTLSLYYPELTNQMINCYK